MSNRRPSVECGNERAMTELRCVDPTPLTAVCTQLRATAVGRIYSRPVEFVHTTRLTTGPLKMQERRKDDHRRTYDAQNVRQTDNGKRTFFSYKQK